MTLELTTITRLQNQHVLMATRREHSAKTAMIPMVIDEPNRRFSESCGGRGKT